MNQDFVDHIQNQWTAELPDVDTSPMGVVARIHRLGNYLRREILAVYREFGLGEGEFDILATLRRSGAPYSLLPTELSRQTMVTSGGISKQLDRLEKADLIARVPSETDGRSKQVQLTLRGLDLIDQAFARHMENEARLLAHLPEVERVALEGILAGWLSRVEQETTDFSA